MTSTTYFYCSVTEGATRHQRKISGSWKFTNEWEAQALAQEAAGDYHSNHDGWESRWPLIFALYDSEDGPERARFSVEREAVPMFTASTIAPPTRPCCSPYCECSPGQCTHPGCHDARGVPL